MKERTKCRLCGCSVELAFMLKPTPIANSFPDKPDSNAERYALDLMQCVGCGHIQQRLVGEGLYEDYRYRTPAAVKEHLAPVARKIATENPGGRVLEIGSNNGMFLECLMAEGLDVLGVDPASTHYMGIKDYFGERVAATLGEFDVIVANNVFAHIDDLDDVFRGISKCLSPSGQLIFEVQYLIDMLETGAFDMIYHEHMDYHHVSPLKPFLRKHGLVMVDCERIKTHGGSIRVTAQKVGVECDSWPERIDWAEFSRKLSIAREHANSLGKVQAFGATAKATTLISQLGLEDKIEFVVDNTPEKQGRYIPGTDIPIYPVEKLHDGPVLMTAWNYEKEIRAQIDNELIHPFKPKGAA